MSPSHNLQHRSEPKMPPIPVQIEPEIPDPYLEMRHGYTAPGITEVIFPTSSYAAVDEYNTLFTNPSTSAAEAGGWRKCEKCVLLVDGEVRWPYGVN
jgi:hypothetical protein